MTNNLLFDFTVDKAKKTVYITREFDADLSLVWDAFTKAELLDQWLAPKPMTSKTKYQDFKVGGKRFYAMVSPEGQERWAIQEYTSITPKTNFKMYNAFEQPGKAVGNFIAKMIPILIAIGTLETTVTTNKKYEFNNLKNKNYGT